MALMAAAAPMVAALALLPVAPAQAAAGDLSCKSALTLNLTPPLKAGGTSNAAISGNLSNCSSSNGQHSDLASGTLSGTGSMTATAAADDPCGLALTGTGTAAIAWASGSKSTFDLKFSPDLSLTATVTDGALKGDVITVTMDGAQPNPGCATDGLSSLAVQGSMAFA
ncbi:hypothetical protein OG203_43145 [Nocardia sp. NBC_01499]|uniref:hypothetical protein n=1 Tax=Nocardia sp. NBC_01499 TaxID=2903597 RepID=UPI003868B598